MNKRFSIRMPERRAGFQGQLMAMAAVALLLLNACSAGRKSADVALRERSPEFLMRQLVSRQVDAQWLDAKAKIDFDDGSMAVGASAAIRMRRDSVIWISVKKLGFEVARAQLTPDSVFVVDRLNNEYTAKDLSYFSKKYNLPADFQVLQAILLGNPVFFSAQPMKVELADQQYLLRHQGGNLENSYWLAPDNFRLRRMSFTDQEQQRNVDVRLDQYGQTPADQKFSYLRNLELVSKETGKVSVVLQFSQVEFNVPKNIKFEIPDRYTRVE